MTRVPSAAGGVPPVPIPIDLSLLARWMDARGLGHGPIERAELLAGGTQNILMRFERGGASYVLRHPPKNKRKNSDETMRREALVLRALAGTGVPHPRLIAAEADTGPLGSAFYVMEPVAGFNPTVEMPDRYRSDGPMQHQMGLAMADAIAAVASVDPAAAGLAGLGRPERWIERQVDRWKSQLDGYRELANYGGPDIPGVDAVAAWLRDHQPSTVQVGLIHGDFHMGNVLFASDAPRIAAVVDWELTTLGDPLLDLGHMLATWPGATPAARPVLASELPSQSELINRYAERTGRPLNDLAWFRVLACYRMGVILEGSYARAKAGLTPPDIGERLHAHTVALFDLARSIIG